MSRQLYIIILLVFVQNSFAQKTKQLVPKDLKSAVEILKATCPDSLKSVIKTTPDEELAGRYYEYRHLYKKRKHWIYIDGEETELERYFSKKGIEDSEHQEKILLIILKYYLLNVPKNEDEIIEPYKIIEDGYREELNIRYAADSLDGVYIPKDLEDSFKQIDIFLNDSIKNVLKGKSEDDFRSDSHFGRGLWIRNNWQLWKGSRLSKYFNDMGIYHPDDISGIIHTSYYRYVTGKEIKLKEQLEYYKKYWKVVKSPNEEIYPKGVNDEMEFNYKQYYNSKKDNSPSCLHIQTNSKSDKVWIYDYHFGWKQLSQKQLKAIELCSQEELEDCLRILFLKK